MAEPKNLDVIMQLIMHGGDAKGNAIEAIEAAKAGDFALANEKITESEKALVEAHHAQTGLLTQEASGDAVELSLLMVHGQDHHRQSFVEHACAWTPEDMDRHHHGRRPDIPLHRFGRRRDGPGQKIAAYPSERRHF